MNIVVISMKTYTNYQRAILIPAVEQVWEEEQEKLLGELRDQPLDLAGDGRCDSPGYGAKYLTYSLHAPHVNKIVHFEQVQCEAVPNSGSMEKEGLIRSLAFTREKELTVRSLATDRHRSIAKHMREKEPAILHFFDVWHVSKSVKKSLNAASKSHDCGSLVGWAQPAVNHMYWCATASRGNPDLLVGAWSSMTRHVVDVHADHPGMYTKCLHEPIEDGEWLVPASAQTILFFFSSTVDSLVNTMPIANVSANTRLPMPGLWTSCPASPYSRTCVSFPLTHKPMDWSPSIVC
ncbi:unnamed protein product [Ixodes pacificus]